MPSRWLLLPLVACALAGCERAMHGMYEQPRLDAGEASPMFADHRGTRPPPPNSVAIAMGDLAATSSGRRGDTEIAQRQVASTADAPPPITRALLLRGQERYSIYCLPCHSALGDGDGPIVRRGFPRPPSYHEQRLRDAPDRHFFDVITRGYGVMYSYADRVTPQDRWAIVAYIRALQLSQHAPLEALPASVRATLAAGPASAAFVEPVR
jgi:mono/diheme cytochrome c family protein